MNKAENWKFSQTSENRKILKIGVGHTQWLFDELLVKTARPKFGHFSQLFGKLKANLKQKLESSLNCTGLKKFRTESSLLV